MDVKRYTLILLLAGIVSIGGFLYSGGVSANETAPRMPVEELKKLLDDPEIDDLIILDVRLGASWDESEQMIQTAIREDPRKFELWDNKYPKEATIVLYCT